MKPHELPSDLSSSTFTVAAARAAGVTPNTLRGRRFRSPHYGMRVLASADTDERSAVIAARTVLPPGTLATRVTGLRLFGVDVGTASPLRFATAHPRQVRRPGVRVTRVAVLPQAWDDLVAVPEYCWMVAALELNLLDLVTAGDWLLRLRFAHRRTLIAYAAQHQPGHRPGPGHSRTGPGTGRLTPRVVAAALPGLGRPADPGLQPDHPRHRVRAEVDLVYKQFRILIEYEGDQHRTDQEQWNTDIDRHEWFSRDGWTLYRVTKARARHPRQVVERVNTMLVEADYQGPAPAFDTRWRELFE